MLAKDSPASNENRNNLAGAGGRRTAQGAAASSPSKAGLDLSDTVKDAVKVLLMDDRLRNQVRVVHCAGL